jgi:hypothetical protein
MDKLLARHIEKLAMEAIDRRVTQMMRRCFACGEPGAHGESFCPREIAIDADGHVGPT